ncbi:hypothetical protein [Halohasta litchfieldiae]|nr:hypothetical protein [Halohasta litchfieldiae]
MSDIHIDGCRQYVDQAGLVVCTPLFSLVLLLYLTSVCNAEQFVGLFVGYVENLTGGIATI